MSRIINFINHIKESSTNVDSYVTKKNLASALKYLTVLLLLISLLMTIPNIYDLFSSIDTEKIPDFELKNGKLTVYAEQPFYLDKNVIIDTTGNITRPVVDEEGYGILISEDAFILKRPFDERRIELSAIDITNKEELETLIYIFLLILLPIIFVIIFLANAIEYLFYILILSFVGYVLIRQKNNFKSIFSICIYSFTPFIVLSYIDLFVHFYIGTIGLIWSLMIYSLVLKKHFLS
ncbi:hypothetical protein Mpsy_2634 [Methanolobus psychrophilus R15]|nr:hypothetical protein Mpsy_2634 [Methanolobus psychrophilus R15]